MSVLAYKRGRGSEGLIRSEERVDVVRRCGHRGRCNSPAINILLEICICFMRFLCKQQQVE